MNKTKDNKLIAEFMGAPMCDSSTPQYDFSKIDGFDIPHNWIYEDRLKFHSSWDWLMPVVIKISNLTYHKELNSGHYYSLFLYNTNQLYGELYCEGDIITHFSRDSDAALTIEKVYNKCLEFIKWYNEQKS